MFCMSFFWHLASLPTTSHKMGGKVVDGAIGASAKAAKG